MTIGFKQIPGNLRLPMFYAELDNSQANSGQSTQRSLIIGQITSAGTALVNVPVLSQGLADSAIVGGTGSMLHLMVNKYRENDSFGELWYLPLADDPASVAATGTITFTSAATAPGTLTVYVAGVKIAQPVVATQTTSQLATALAASINSTPNMPVTASAAINVVTLTARNKGPAGNEIDIRLNYLGTRGGELTPQGLVASIVAMASGATAPSMATAFANLAGMTFDFIVCPYSDVASLNSLAALLNDSTGRWSWSNQLYGHAFCAHRGTVGALTTLGAARNDQHVSLLGVNDSPTPTWLWAASFGAAVAVSIRADPALPLQTVPLRGVLAPPLQSRFQLQDRNVLLWDAISTFMVADDGTVQLENVITTYQKNGFNVEDDSYLQVETLFTLAAVLRYMKGVVTSKFGRVKLAANGTRLPPGSAVVTPNIIRAELIAAYRYLEEELGLVENADAFKAGLIVEQNPQNPNRVDVLWPGDLINQLRIFAVLAQFRL
jgi:phage tail sheath gpL-like